MIPNHTRPRTASRTTCALLGCAALLALACAGPKRHISDDYGDAYRDAFQAQVVNPSGAQDATPAEGLPGEVANRVYEERYVESLLEEPEVQPSASQQVRQLR